MNRLLLPLILVFTLVACNGEDKSTLSASAPDDTARSAWTQIKDSAVALISPSKPRQVARGAQPEIVINRTGIHINGKTVALGQSMAEWKKVIPGTPRCKEPKEKEVNSCMWDELGIFLLEYRSTVFEFNIFFYLSPWRDTESIGADGTVYPPEPDWRPKHPYTGYFEMDGYAIDAKTTFDEISGNVDPVRGLHCGRFDDCARRYGGHFAPKASLTLTMTRSDSKGKLKLFSVAAGETDFLPPTPPEECTPDSLEAKAKQCVPLPSHTTTAKTKR